MISTLFAQEFRTTRKWLFTSVGITLLVAAVAFAVTLFNIPVLRELGLGIGIIATAMITPIVMGLLAANYWTTMYGKEGYFTMALPVHGRSLYAVKTTYAAIVTVIAAAITVFGILAGVLAFAVAQGASISESLAGMREALDAVGAGLVWFFIACVVLQLVFTVIAGATLMSVGAEGRFNHLGFGAPVIGAILLYVVMQIVGFASMMFVPFGLKLTEPGFGTLVAQGMWHDFVESLSASGSDEPSIIGLGIVLVSLVIAVVLAWWGARSVERHTSLR